MIPAPQRGHLAAVRLGQADLVVVELAGLGVMQGIEEHDLEDLVGIEETDQSSLGLGHSDLQ